MSELLRNYYTVTLPGHPLQWQVPVRAITELPSEWPEGFDLPSYLSEWQAFLFRNIDPEPWRPAIFNSELCKP